MNEARSNYRLFGWVVFIALMVSTFPARGWAEIDPFPTHPILQPNVSFWKDIYARYASNQGVLHDKQDLDIVYAVIDLEYPHLPGSSRVNQQRIKEAKKKYRDILRKLARGETPADSDEQRIVDLFGWPADSAVYYHASHRIRCQVGQRDYFKAGLIRSGAYLDQIKQIFRQQGLPEDLAYLPHVESSFNPNAYSKFGAAGIWQFTRSTGKQFMRVDYSVDERRDPIIASHAAARLLKRNYERLQDWPLAITAYNHGLNGMLRAQKAEGPYEAIFADYRSRIFKFASRNFYSEFLAAREVAKSYRQYFGELEMDAPVNHSRVVLAGYASLPELAGALALDMETIRRLNPALRNPVITGQKYIPKGYPLNLPEAPDREWAAVLADLSDQLFKEEQKHSRFYTVRRGDTAGKIAHTHGIRLEDLLAANTLGRSATIYVDQVLTIPLPGEAPRRSAELIARNTAAEPLKTAQAETPPSQAEKPQTQSPILLAQADEVPPARPDHETYRLKFAASVSNKDEPDSEPADIPPAPDTGVQAEGDAGNRQDQNDANTAGDQAPEQPPVVKDASAPEGQNPPVETADALHEEPPQIVATLDSWLVRDLDRRRVMNAAAIVAGNLSLEEVLDARGNRIGIIRVEVEETIGHYAEWTGVRAHEIRQLNGFRYGRPIHLGQKLKIPLERVSKEDFEERRYEYHKELVENFLAAYRVEDLQPYTIKRGDNIWTLAREEFDLPLWLIRRYNADVDLNALMPSQTLLIPVVEKDA